MESTWKNPFLVLPWISSQEKWVRGAVFVKMGRYRHKLTGEPGKPCVPQLLLRLRAAPALAPQAGGEITGCRRGLSVNGPASHSCTQRDEIAGKSNCKHPLHVTQCWVLNPETGKKANQQEKGLCFYSSMIFLLRKILDITTLSPLHRISSKCKHK